MEVLNLLCIVSITLTLLVFGALMGFALKTLKVSKKTSIITVLTCFLIILIIAKTFELNLFLINTVNNDNTLILLIIGFISLILGMIMIKKSKYNKMETNRIKILSFTFIPLFITILILLMSFFSVQINFNIFSSALIIATVLIIFSSVFYFLSENNMSFKRLFIFFSNLNFFLGSFSVILYLILPNVLESLNNQMGGIEIDSPMLLGVCFGTFIFLVIIGLFLTKKNSFLIK